MRVGRVWQMPQEVSKSRQPSFCCSLSWTSAADANAGTPASSKTAMTPFIRQPPIGLLVRSKLSLIRRPDKPPIVPAAYPGQSETRSMKPRIIRLLRPALIVRARQLASRPARRCECLFWISLFSALRRQHHAIEVLRQPGEISRRADMEAIVRCALLHDLVREHLNPGAVHLHLIVVTDRAARGRATIRITAAGHLGVWRNQLRVVVLVPVIVSVSEVPVLSARRRRGGEQQREHDDLDSGHLRASSLAA